MDFTLEELQILIRGLEHKYGQHIEHNHPEVTTKETLTASNLRERLISKVNDEIFEETYGK